MEIENDDFIEMLFKEGSPIQDKVSGVYFISLGKKLYTNMKIHTDLGGNPMIFKAWEDSQ
mgnify:FL=1